jgi:hypothetical protein
MRMKLDRRKESVKVGSRGLKEARRIRVLIKRKRQADQKMIGSDISMIFITT